MAKRGGGRRRQAKQRSTVVPFPGRKQMATAGKTETALAGSLEVIDLARQFAEWRVAAGLKPQIEVERCKIQFFSFLEETGQAPRLPPISAVPPCVGPDGDGAEQLAIWKATDADWIGRHEDLWRSMTRVLGAMFEKRIAGCESRYATLIAKQRASDARQRAQWILFDEPKGAKVEGARAARDAA